METAKVPISETAALPLAAQWGRVCPLLPLTPAPSEPAPTHEPPLPAPTNELPTPPPANGAPSWQVKAAARAESGALTLEVWLPPAAPTLIPATPTPAMVSVADSTSPPPSPPELEAIPSPPPPATPETLWEETPEQAAEHRPPPLPAPETVQTLRVSPLHRFFGHVPLWQLVVWLGLMAIAVGGGLVFGRWVIGLLPERSPQTAVTAPKPALKSARAQPPALLTLTTARATTVWSIGAGRLERYDFRVPYATAHLVILTGRQNVATMAAWLMEQRWFGSGRFEPDATQTQRLPVTLCGQALDKTREEGLYRLDERALPAVRDRLLLPRGDRQQALVLVAYGRNPPRLADEMLKSLACR